MSRPLDRAEVDRQLADLPGWACFAGALRTRYAAPGFPAAVRLVTEVADAAEEMDHHPDVDLRYTRVGFALWTHTTGGVTQLDVELAHRVAGAASSVGARIDPAALRRVEIAIDCVDAAALLPFWRTVLGLTASVGDDDAPVLRDPDGMVPTVWFQPMHPSRKARSRTHVDVYVPDDEAPGRVDAVLAAGGRLLSDEHAPQWWVLADPEGNEACVCSEAAP